MKRPLLLLLLIAFVVPACRTAAPRLAPKAAAANPLGAYIGELRLVRVRDDKPRLRVDARGSLAGTCVIAVRVGEAALDGDAARFSLATLGVPRVKGRPADCRRVPPELRLSITGLPVGADANDLKKGVDAVLQTPEAYLAGHGVRFSLPAGAEPLEAASREPFASNAEQSLARHIAGWPTALLSVDPWYRAASRRLRQQSELELDAVVGADGRLYRPRVRTALAEGHQAAVLATLGLWRFEPARRGEAAFPARVALRPVLFLY